MAKWTWAASPSASGAQHRVCSGNKMWRRHGAVLFKWRGAQRAVKFRVGITFDGDIANASFRGRCNGSRFMRGGNLRAPISFAADLPFSVHGLSRNTVRLPALFSACGLLLPRAFLRAFFSTPLPILTFSHWCWQDGWACGGVADDMAALVRRKRT